MKKHFLLIGLLTLGLLAGCHRARGYYPDMEEVPALEKPMPHNTSALEPGATYGNQPDAPVFVPATAPTTRPAAKVAAPARESVNPSPSPTGKPPLSKLYGLAVRASHVVYVIDRSGSTNQYWDSVRKEVLISIGDLWLDQDFTVILMGERAPRQGPAKGLIQATKHNQALAAAMLLETDAAGNTDPVAALRLAIMALNQADKKAGKVIYFLTDRPMMDKASLEVPAASRDVLIMTYMIGRGGADTRSVLENLAADTGGRFTHVETP